MLALSGNVSKMIATGGASLMLQNGQGYKKKPKALMNQMNELMDIVGQLQLEHSKKEATKLPIPLSRPRFRTKEDHVRPRAI